MITDDLSKFGFKELQETGMIINEYCDDNMTHRAREHITSGIKVMFNTESGNVFIVDEDYNTLMYNDELKMLDLWLYTPYDGREGFFDDLMNEYDDMCDEDKEYMKSYDTERVIEDKIEDDKDNDREVEE